MLGDNRRQQELHQHLNSPMAFPRCVVPKEVASCVGQTVRRKENWGQVVSGEGDQTWHEAMTHILREEPDSCHFSLC